MKTLDAIKSIKKLNITKNDVLLVEMPKGWTNKAADGLCRELLRVGVLERCLLYTGDVKFTAARIQPEKEKESQKETIQ